MFWLILLIIVVVAVGVYVFRVPLMAKLLGQSPSRVQREIDRRKR